MVGKGHAAASGEAELPASGSWLWLSLAGMQAFVHQGFLLFLVMLFVGGGLLSGCGLSGDVTSEKEAAQNTYDVAPIFREFYESLGGEHVLGKAISPVFNKDNAQCQYTMNVLLCQNPAADVSQRFYLDSLGNMMNMRDVPGTFPESANQPVVDGFIIFPDFFPIYTSFYGTRYAGRALTQVRYNYEDQRVEQYFENIAVAHDFEAPEQKAYLMPLGLYFCGQQCSLVPSQLESGGKDKKDVTSADGMSTEEVATPFAAAIQQMGGFEVFGRPVSHPFFSQDGSLMHIFENVVVCSPADAPEKAGLCPMTTAIGIPQSAAGQKQYDIQENMMFYIVEGELGFHVPLVFDSFIQQHGGRRASGNPIGEVTQHQDGTIRQCFESYCLDYDREPGEGEVHLAPLGQQYLETGLQQGWIPQNVVLGNGSADNIVVMAGEEKPQINSQESQTIYVSVLQGNTRTPLAGATCQMVVSLPDARQFSMDFPLTNTEGNTSQVIPAMPDLQSGSMVSYTVCLDSISMDTTQVCATDAYLVWNSD